MKTVKSFATSRWRYATALVGCSVFFWAFFSPVIFGGRYLTWGDGLPLALPAFLGRHELWEPNIMLGYPWASNLNGYWYPLAWLRLIPNSFNAYMTAAYVLAAFGVYGLVSSLTRSTVAAIVASGAYTLGGFMTSHSGHYDIVQPAAWTPFVMWSLVELKSSVRMRWIAAAAIGIAMVAIAGQPQVLVYTLFLALAYVITMSVGSSRDPRFFKSGVFSVGLGLATAAVALLPAAELAHESVRAKLTLSDFLAFSAPPVEIPIRLFFPYFLGGTNSPVYPFSTDGSAFTELSIFVGIASLVFALLAVMTMWFSREVRFWCIASLVALILSTGDGLRLGWFFYHVPILNLFRAQGRHALEFTLSAAVLSGFGVAAVERGRARLRQVVLAILLVGALMAATLAGICLLYGDFAREVAATTGTALPIVPWRNPALGIPIFIFLCVGAAIVAWSRRPMLWTLQALLLGSVALDMAAFAWFGPWRVAAVAPSDLAPPHYVSSLRADLDRTDMRLLSTTGALPPAVVPPNISLLWGIPAAGGYVQLELARMAAFLEMSPTGAVDSEIYTRDGDQALDLAAVRYVATTSASAGDRPVFAPFAGADLNERIGAPALVPTKTFRISFPNSLYVTRVALVSNMGDSTMIADRTPVADILIKDAHRRTVILSVLAGRDTSEVAYDRPDVRPLVKHARAPLFSTDGFYHSYITSYALPKRTLVRSLAIHWLYSNLTHGVLTIDWLSFLDDATRRARPITIETILVSDSTRWRRIAGTAPDAVFENRAAHSRAWIVHRVVPSTPEEALAAIRQGSYDTRRVALVEDAPRFENRAATGRERVTVTELGPMSETLDVTCASSCFVVTSDTYYQGWDATVDGAPAEIYRADYALRGVFVPPGNHRLRFEYHPKTVAAGAVITVLALGVISFLSFASFASRRANAAQG